MLRVQEDHTLWSRSVKDQVAVTKRCNNVQSTHQYLLHLIRCSEASWLSAGTEMIWSDSDKFEPPLSISKSYTESEGRPFIMIHGYQRFARHIWRMQCMELIPHWFPLSVLGCSCISSVALIRILRQRVWDIIYFLLVLTLAFAQAIHFCRRTCWDI